MHRFSIFCLVSICLILAQSCSKTYIYPEDSTPKKNYEYLIVRIPTNYKKIDFLKSALRDQSIDKDATLRINNQLNETLLENKTYFEMVRNSLDKKFDYCPILFVPDSLYKEYLAGNENVFLDENKNRKTIALKEFRLLHLLPQETKERFVLTDKFGNKFDAPLPHKRNSFMPWIKIEFNREGFVNDEIEWFNDKLKKARYLP